MIAVTGAEGLIGTACVRAFASRGHAVAALPRAALDIQDRAAVAMFLKRHTIEAIVCAAARPYVEGCERDPANTRGVNVDATVAVARAVTEQDAMFVAFSSEYVFDGTARRSYTEADERNPINEYGRQKRDLEDALAQLPHTLIIRTSGVYGIESRRKNFVYSLVDKARSRQRVPVPSDQLITPTYADNLADIIAQMLERRMTGVLHVAGPEPMSRFAFAQLVARTFGVEAAAIVPCATASLHLLAPRPQRAALSVERARQLNVGPFIAPREGLARMCRALASTPQ